MKLTARIDGIAARMAAIEAERVRERVVAAALAERATRATLHAAGSADAQGPVAASSVEPQPQES